MDRKDRISITIDCSEDSENSTVQIGDQTVEFNTLEALGDAVERLVACPLA